MRFFALVAVPLLLALPVSLRAQNKSEPPVRVALVSSAPGDAANALLDLAQVKVSAQPGVELLERQAVTRVLLEQKLSASGLVDANSAAALGKLLSVELFGIVEVDPLSKDALGLMIYDTATGIKLHDASLPPGKLDAQVEAMSDAVRHAASKHTAGHKGLRTVCVLSARNADLPRSQDALGQAIAFLLERHLLDSPSLAVLERKRLDLVNKEKSLPILAKHKDLLASLILVDVEVGRGTGGNGVRATAFLTTNDGKQIGKVQVEEASPQAAVLAQKLQTALWKYWQAELPAKSPDPVRESKRFQQEGKRLFSQKEWLAALRALEASHALTPDNPAVRLDLVKYLSQQSIALIHPDIPFGVTPSGKFKPPADRAKDALHLSLRILELRRQTFEAVRGKGFFPLLTYFIPYKDTRLNRFGDLEPVPADGDYQELRRQYVEQLRGLLHGELEEWGEVAHKDALSPNPNTSFQYLTMAVQLADLTLRNAGVPLAEVERFLLPSFRRWAEIAALPRTKLNETSITQLCRDSMPTRPDYEEVYRALEKNAHPQISLFGRWHLLKLGMKTQKLSARQAQIAYQEIRQAAFKALKDHRPTSKVAPGDDPRTTLYFFLQYTADQWTYPNPDQKSQERFALCDFMLDRREAVSQVIVQAVQNEFKPTNFARRWDLSERAIQLADSGQHQLCASPSAMKYVLGLEQKRILAARPEFAKKQAFSPPPWSHAEPLLQIKDFPGIEQRGLPLLDGDDVYVPAAGREKDRVVLWLLHASLKDRASRVLGKTDLRPFTSKLRNLPEVEILGSCLANDRIFVATRHDGIVVFNRAGKASLVPTKGWPAQHVEAMAYHDGKLYVALLGGYLLAANPETGSFEILASSRRRERLSPFDDSEVFRVSAIIVDAPRDRLLLLLYQKPSHAIIYASLLFPPSETTNGLWEYDLKTKTFKRHLELYYDALLWSSSPREGRLLLSKVGDHTTGVVDFELATNKSRLLWASFPVGPEMPKEKAVSQADYFPMRTPRLVDGDWIWTVYPLGRFSLARRAEEIFAPLGKVPDFHDYGTVSMDPVGSRQVLLGNHSGLWLLTFKQEK